MRFRSCERFVKLRILPGLGRVYPTPGAIHALQCSVSSTSPCALCWYSILFRELSSSLILHRSCAVLLYFALGIGVFMYAYGIKPATKAKIFTSKFIFYLLHYGIICIIVQNDYYVYLFVNNSK